MRLEYPHRTERFGAVRIGGPQRVIELDAGPARPGVEDLDDLSLASFVPRHALDAMKKDLAIVVPCMNETRIVLEGVLAAIPHDCLIILVSNSAREPVDRFEMEAETLLHLCRVAGRTALAVHQRDPGLASALKAAGLPEIVGPDGLVRHGKGEAMLVGVALAALSGRNFVGFVDADNYVPGAVAEYCTAFAAGLHLAATPYSMVRISWGSKPKLRDGRVFYSRHGRSSEVTNRFMNRLLAEHSGFGTEVIATGNAGEHAMSVDLALKLRLAGGFAVEPFELIDLFEQFGGVLESSDREVMARSVQVTQIETRNPHFHDDKGDDHVVGMRSQALNVLYHSPVCLPAVRDDIRAHLVAEGVLVPGAEPCREVIYPPLSTIALDVFLDVLGTEAETFRQVWRRAVAGLSAEGPLRPGGRRSLEGLDTFDTLDA